MTSPGEDPNRDLAISEARHRLLAEHANDVIWTMGLDGAITYVSPSRADRALYAAKGSRNCVRSGAESR